MVGRFVALSLLLAAAASADPNCPPNQFYGLGGPVKSSTLPKDSMSTDVCELFTCGTFSARYDIPLGSFHVSTVGGIVDVISFKVVAQDDFRVTGLPPGSPVSVVAHLSVTLLKAGAHLKDAAAHDASALADLDPVVTDLSLPIAATAEQPFLLQVELSSILDSAGGANGAGTLSFSGLPPGATVVSCNGYVGDQSTLARATSWGKLKRIYR